MKLMLNGKEVTGMGHYVMAGDIKDATAEDSNVLSGKAYYNNNGKREGTMPNRGGMSAELTAGGSVSILEGYHNGEGVVRAQDLASQTQGTAAAANIEAGYTAWVNGQMVEGALETVKRKEFDGVESYVGYDIGVTIKANMMYCGFITCKTNNGTLGKYAFRYTDVVSGQNNLTSNSSGKLKVQQNAYSNSSAGAKTIITWSEIPYDVE